MTPERKPAAKSRTPLGRAQQVLTVEEQAHLGEATPRQLFEAIVAGAEEASGKKMSIPALQHFAAQQRAIADQADLEIARLAARCRSIVDGISAAIGPVTVSSFLERAAEERVSDKGKKRAGKTNRRPDARR